MRFTAFVILALNTVAVSLADQKTNEAKPADEPMFALDIGYVPANGPQFAYIRYCSGDNCVRRDSLTVRLPKCQKQA